MARISDPWNRADAPNKLSGPATKVNDDDLNTSLGVRNTSIHLLMVPTCHCRRRAAPTYLFQDAGCPIWEYRLRLSSAGLRLEMLLSIHIVHTGHLDWMFQCLLPQQALLGRLGTVTGQAAHSKVC